MENRKSWNIKDEAILDDLVALMGLTDDEKALLAALQDQAQAIAPKMVEAFYERLLAHPNTAEYLEGKTDHLKKTLQNWFGELFQGNYDQDYVQGRLTIGRIHVRIGLPVRYPLAMIDLMLKFGEEITDQSSQADQAAAAFRKLLALDVAIFNQAYEDTQLKHLSEMVGNERLARRLLTQ